MFKAGAASPLQNTLLRRHQSCEEYRASWFGVEGRKPRKLSEGSCASPFAAAGDEMFCRHWQMEVHSKKKKGVL